MAVVATIVEANNIAAFKIALDAAMTGMSFATTRIAFSYAPGSYVAIIYV